MDDGQDRLTEVFFEIVPAEFSQSPEEGSKAYRYCQTQLFLSEKEFFLL